MKTHPTITIEQHSEHARSMAYCAAWRTDAHRFHVWLDDTGRPQYGPDTPIHRNPIETTKGSRRDEHRLLRGDSANGKVSLAAIAAAVAAGGLAQAAEVAAAKRAAAEAAYELAQRTAAQELLDRLWAEGYRPTGEASALELLRVIADIDTPIEPFRAAMTSARTLTGCA